MNKPREMRKKIEKEVRRQPMLIFLFFVLAVVNVFLMNAQMNVVLAICCGVFIFLALLWAIPALVAHTITELLYP